MDDDSGFDDWALRWQLYITALPVETIRLGKRLYNVPKKLWWCRRNPQASISKVYRVTFENIRRVDEPIALARIATGEYRIPQLGPKMRDELVRVLGRVGVTEPNPIAPAISGQPEGGGPFQIVVSIRPGEAQDYGALRMILSHNVDDIHEYGPDIVARLSFWLDLFINEMSRDDVPELRKELGRVTEWLSTLRP